MEKKKTRKKWREIRSAVTMMCVMAAMLSTATFAWFTLTSSPTVSGMQMTATSESGLVVSTDGADNNWFNAIALTESTEIKSLKPVTPDTDGFYPPVYTGGTVTGKGNVLNLSTDTGYVANYEFHMKPEGGAEVAVGLIGGANTQTDLSVDANHVAAASGTLVTEYPADGTVNGAYAVRMGILPAKVKDGDSYRNSTFADMIVIEPNSDGTGSGKFAPTDNGMDAIATAFASDVKFKENGDLGGDGQSGNISDELFYVPADGVEVALYIWIEGTDAQCVNEIMADKLLAQVQFTVIED